MGDKFYAGVGSRQTPADVCLLMNRIAKRLAEEGHTLRSGHAQGADLAFEYGADEAKCLDRCRKEIWLPCDGFNGAPYVENTSGWSHVVVSDDHYYREKARHFHPAWEKLSPFAKKLMIRNVGQILGRETRHLGSVDDPDPEISYSRAPKSAFVICWTRGGQATGGTGQAIRVAKAYDVPVLNLWQRDVRQRAEAWLAS